MGVYFENRQNALPTSEEEMERVFKCLATHFKHDWLKSKSGANPLQLLWNRRDALSTNELYFFGICVEQLEIADKNWLRKQVTQIKSGQANNRMGAIFEIIAIGMFRSSGNNVTPTKNNQPGYDGIFTLPDSKSMRISLKNYGDSASFNEFNSYGKKAEAIIVKELAKHKIVNKQVFISCVEYPSTERWKTLLDNIPQIIAAYKPNEPTFAFIDNFWQVGLTNLDSKEFEFNPQRNSYVLIMMMPFHKNEQKNLLDKLDEACHNLIKHARNEDENTVNTVFIHLPENASIHKCTKWGQEYFSNKPDAPITCIILYQPTITTDLEKNTSSIHHCFQFVIKQQKLSQWNSLGSPIQISIPVGKVDLQPAKNLIIVEVDGKTEQIEVSDQYLFQSGHYYLLAKKQADGSIFGTVPKLASGIFVHSFFQPFPGQAGIELAGHHAPKDKLLIL